MVCKQQFAEYLLMARALENCTHKITLRLLWMAIASWRSDALLSLSLAHARSQGAGAGRPACVNECRLSTLVLGPSTPGSIHFPCVHTRLIMQYKYGQYLHFQPIPAPQCKYTSRILYWPIVFSAQTFNLLQKHSNKAE